MRAVWKFTLRTIDLQVIALPAGARLLDVQMQHGDPQLWAEVDIDAPIEPRVFAIVGTGHPMPEPVGEYVATFQIVDFGLVFHVYAAPVESVPDGTYS